MGIKHTVVNAKNAFFAWYASDRGANAVLNMYTNTRQKSLTGSCEKGVVWVPFFALNQIFNLDSVILLIVWSYMKFAQAIYRIAVRFRI